MRTRERKRPDRRWVPWSAAGTRLPPVQLQAHVERLEARSLLSSVANPPSITASAALAQASSGTISSKGPFVDADIYSTDSNGIYREIYVDASTSTNHQPGGPPANSSFTFVEYFTYDSNTGSYDAGYGYIGGTFKVAANLASASLTASGTAYSVYDNSPHTVTLDLSLTASGPKMTESVVEHFSVGPVKYVNKFMGTDQPATAAGDATLDSVDLGTFNQYFADIGSSKSSQLTIST